MHSFTDFIEMKPESSRYIIETARKSPQAANSAHRRDGHPGSRPAPRTPVGESWTRARNSRATKILVRAEP